MLKRPNQATKAKKLWRLTFSNGQIKLLTKQRFETVPKSLMRKTKVINRLTSSSLNQKRNPVRTSYLSGRQDLEPGDPFAPKESNAPTWAAPTPAFFNRQKDMMFF